MFSSSPRVSWCLVWLFAARLISLLFQKLAKALRLPDCVKTVSKELKDLIPLKVPPAAHILASCLRPWAVKYKFLIMATTLLASWCIVMHDAVDVASWETRKPTWWPPWHLKDAREIPHPQSLSHSTTALVCAKCMCMCVCVLVFVCIHMYMYNNNHCAICQNCRFSGGIQYPFLLQEALTNSNAILWPIHVVAHNILSLAKRNHTA